MSAVLVLVILVLVILMMIAYLDNKIAFDGHIVGHTEILQQTTHLVCPKHLKHHDSRGSNGDRGDC